MFTLISVHLCLPLHSASPDMSEERGQAANTCIVLPNSRWPLRVHLEQQTFLSGKKPLIKRWSLCKRCFDGLLRQAFLAQLPIATAWGWRFLFFRFPCVCPSGRLLIVLQVQKNQVQLLQLAAQSQSGQ